jgi:actin-related protein 9
VGLRKLGGGNASTSNGNPSLDARVSDYLVGSALEDALGNGDAIELYWPFAEGKIVNWAQAEAIWWVTVLTPLTMA